MPSYEHTLVQSMMFDLRDLMAEILYIYLFHIDSMIVIVFFVVYVNNDSLFNESARSPASTHQCCLLSEFSCFCRQRVYLPTILAEDTNAFNE
jgi:hypothetical protein